VRANQGALDDQRNILDVPHLCPIALTILIAISNCCDEGTLDELARTMWQAHVAGSISENEARLLSAAIDGRRTPRPQRGDLKPVSRGMLRPSRFLPRRRQYSPDHEASRNRRRMLGGSSALPENLRHHYTEAQRAVLFIVAAEVKRHGICDLPIDKIAAMAGVCRTTVQTTQHEARRLGHIRVTERPLRGRKSLTNIIEIISLEWRVWIKRGPSNARGIGSKRFVLGLNLASPTKSIERKKAAFGKEVWEAGRVKTFKHRYAM
jgi:hypothetical protein